MDATAKEEAVGDLGLIAFFYLLRVGEYTQKQKLSLTRTIQFRFRDFAFKKSNTIISRDASEVELLEATGATLRLINQKNSVRGAVIHRSPMEGRFCPVKALVLRYIHLRNHHASLYMTISTYWDHLGSGNVTDVDIRLAIRCSMLTLDLVKNGITEDRVVTHSLRAGGAMAIKFAGGDRDDIKNWGDGHLIPFWCTFTTNSGVLRGVDR